MVVVFDNWGKSSMPHNSAGDLFGMVNSPGCNRDLQRGQRGWECHELNPLSVKTGAIYIYIYFLYIYISSLKIHFPFGTSFFWGWSSISFTGFHHHTFLPPSASSSRAGLHLQFCPFRCTQTGIRTSAFFMAGQRGVSTLPRKLRFSRVLHQKKWQPPAHTRL